jgi:hypothetical protein
VKRLALVGELIVATIVSSFVELLLVVVLCLCWVIHRPVEAFANWFLERMSPVFDDTQAWQSEVEDELRDFD